MQNRYVGDVGDFGKFGLLRFLSGMTDPAQTGRPLQIGVNWYLFHDERHGAFGNHTGYLVRTPKEDRSEYRDCDPDLWDRLRDLVLRPETRCVHCAEQAGILPEDTRYYRDLLGFPSKMSHPKRVWLREDWLAGALRAVQDTDLVCVDPDNGIAPNSYKMYHADGPKYAYMDDLRPLWERGQSLVVYHHLGMEKGGAAKMVADAAGIIAEGLGVEPLPLLYRRGTFRVFFVVPQPGEAGDLVRDRAVRFLDNGWGEYGHFELVS